MVVRTRSGRKYNRAYRIHPWRRRFFPCGKSEGAYSSNKCLRCLCSLPRMQHANQLRYQPFQRTKPTSAVGSNRSPRRSACLPFQPLFYSLKSCAPINLSAYRRQERAHSSFVSWYLVMKRMPLEDPKASHPMMNVAWILTNCGEGHTPTSLL